MVQTLREKLMADISGKSVPNELEEFKVTIRQSIEDLEAANVKRNIIDIKEFISKYRAVFNTAMFDRLSKNERSALAIEYSNRFDRFRPITLTDNGKVLCKLPAIFNPIVSNNVQLDTKVMATARNLGTHHNPVIADRVNAELVNELNRYMKRSEDMHADAYKRYGDETTEIVNKLRELYSRETSQVTVQDGGVQEEEDTSGIAQFDF